MLRPICTLGRRLNNKPTNIRSKVIYPASNLSKRNVIKAWNSDDKILFGALQETAKEKAKRLVTGVKRIKNDQSKTQNDLSTSAAVCCNEINSPDVPVLGKTVHKVIKKERVSELNAQVAPGVPLANESSVKVEVSSMLAKKNLGDMWSNLRQGLKFSNSKISTRNYRVTPRYGNASQNTTAAKRGYENDEKVLQVKPDKTDLCLEYPSVTLILNKTMTEESSKALQKWKQERIAEMGEEAFNKFYEAQMAAGTKFHNVLKTYFTQPRSKLIIEKDVEGVWNSVSELLKNITSPKAVESNVVHPVLKYRGIFDAIADYEDKPTLIEWKKSDKPRPAISMTYDNPVQLAAYFGAISNDLNYKHFNVRDTLLVIAYTDGSKADMFHLSADKLRQHWSQWLSRLEAYLSAHGSDDIKRLKGGKRLFEEDIGNLE